MSNCAGAFFWLVLCCGTALCCSTEREGEGAAGRAGENTKLHTKYEMQDNDAPRHARRGFQPVTVTRSLQIGSAVLSPLTISDSALRASCRSIRTVPSRSSTSTVASTTPTALYRTPKTTTRRKL